MDAYCLVKESQLPVLQALFEHIAFLMEHVTYFTDPKEYFIALNHSTRKTPDVVLLDYTFYQPEIYNPYIEMKNSKKPVPVCIYNDPYPKEEDRAAYWTVKNKKFLCPEVSESEIDSIKDFFHLIQIELLRPEINPYLSVISRPKIFSKEAMWLDSFIASHRIPPSRQKLLKFLFENRNKSVSKEEICLYLWNGCNEENLKNLYTYIHDLRNIFRFASGAKVNFYNDYKSYQFLFELKDEPEFEPEIREYDVNIEGEKID